MTVILQTSLPITPWAGPRAGRLPGTQPAAPDDWVRVDDAYGPQMALRDRLLSERRGEVLDALPGAAAACAELLEAGVDRAGRLPGFTAGKTAITRPDGQEVAIDPSDPLGTLGRLFQEDFCILEKPDGAAEHILTAAVLCFPASWMLSEKIGRPLTGIHDPVPEYDPVAHRVQRLFDGLRVGRPIWRANALLHDDPALFLPRREADPRPEAASPRYLRSERQTLFRLPGTRAVVFSIHTYVVRVEDLTPDQRATKLA